MAERQPLTIEQLVNVQQGIIWALMGELKPEVGKEGTFFLSLVRSIKARALVGFVEGVIIGRKTDSNEVGKLQATIEAKLDSMRKGHPRWIVGSPDLNVKPARISNDDQEYAVSSYVLKGVLVGSGQAPLELSMPYGGEAIKFADEPINFEDGVLIE